MVSHLTTALAKLFYVIACRTNDTAVLHLVHTAKRTKIICLQTQCTPVPFLQFAWDLPEIFKEAIGQLAYPLLKGPSPLFSPQSRR